MININENESIKEEIIEETTEEFGCIIKYKTSDLIKIINEYYQKNENNENCSYLNYENFGKNHNIPKIICQKTKVNNYIFYKEIYYNDVKLLLTPIIIDFVDLNGKSDVYKIYNSSYIYKIIETLNFTNPVIIIKEQKEYPISSLNKVLSFLCDEFKIVDKEAIKFDSLFSEENKVNDKSNSIKIGLDLTKNFKYYFKYPKPEEEFLFICSNDRSRIISNNFQMKITGLCGPMGIGKSTTLLAFLKNKENYCYLNIKALKENEDNILVWKDKLLLLEVAYTLRKKYKLEVFKELKEKLDSIYLFWEAIITMIKYFIKRKIKINFIFDQYKQKIDPNYKNLKNIKDTLEKDSTNIILIIISSSINDKDVRNSLLSQWFKIKQDFQIDYVYLKSLINIKDYIKNDLELTETQRNMIINDFNSIPKFYYSIRALNTESKLNDYKILQIEKIRNSINGFFSESDNLLGREEIESLINFRGKFGCALNKIDFLKLLKILPFKYFKFDLTNNIIDFSFQLVKDIFDDFLSNKICNFLRSPISLLKEGTIGDILELNLIKDLSNNSFCKFDQIIKINSIWNMNEIKPVKISNESKCILLLQENTEAIYIDFGILNNREDLLLYQCKKAFKKSPDNFITRTIIEENKAYLTNKFKEYFDISLKRVFLYYITGITFFMKDNKKQFRTWGIKENENFQINIKIAKNSQAELLYYDVLNRKIYIANEEEFEAINDLIQYANKFSSPISMEIKNNVSEENYAKLEILSREYYNSVSESLKKINCDNKEEFFSSLQKAYLKKNYFEIYSSNIFGFIKDPEIIDLNYKRMIGLKRNNKKYLLIEKMNKIKDENRKKEKGNKQKKEQREKLNKGKIDDEKEEVIEEKKRYKTKRSLVMVKDNGLEEIKNIGEDFYDKIEYAFIFDKNVILSDI